MSLPAILTERGPRMALVVLSLMLIQCGGGSGSGLQGPAPDPIVGGPTGPVAPPNPAPVPPPEPAPPPEATGTALLSWVPPTERVDGTTLELAGFRVYVGTEPGLWDREIHLTNPGLTSYLVEQLAPGTWYFTVTAVDSEGVESDPSGIATKHISG